MIRSKFPILVSPLLCLGLLGGIVAQDRTHLKPTDVEGYHARAKAAIEAWPKTIEDGDWTTTVDAVLPASAEELLHPNCVINRSYVSNGLRVNGRNAQATLLIVQCKDTRDMAGHYPPICYPASGYPQLSSRRFKLAVDGAEIIGFEYEFLRQVLPAERQSIYNFFIVPGKGFVADMDGVRAAAKNYQGRYYGASQFQVVMDAGYPPDVQEQIFKMIIGANSKALTVLNTVKSQ